MENTKSGETCDVALKHDESDDVDTNAATLVPPEPNPVLSLTYDKKRNIISVCCNRITQGRKQKR